MLAMETEMKTQPTTRGGRGFTRIELFVVIGVIVWLLAMLFLALAPAKRKASKIHCVNNSMQFTMAAKIWADDNSNKFPMQFAVTNNALMKLISHGNAYLLWQTMSNELVSPMVLVCPADKERTVATSFGQGFSDANISYFLNLDASDAYPQMILAGDDNLEVNGTRVPPGILSLSTNASVGWAQERHGGAGNIALSDGSVQTTTSTALQQAVQSAGSVTNRQFNRLVIP